MTEAQAYRRDALVIAAALAAVLCLCFAPFLFGGSSLMSAAREVGSVYPEGANTGRPPIPPRTVDPGAAGWQVEPWLPMLHHTLFEEHRIPFWEPFDGYGTPLIATIVPQPFYPLTTLSALSPTPRSYAWFNVARLFLAGFFAALFLRLFFSDRWSAIGGGIATMLAGYFLIYYNMPHLSVEVGFPMLLWGTELCVRKVTGPRIAALAVATGLVYLGGMPESAFLAIVASTIYAGVRLLTSDGPRLPRLAALAVGNLLGLTLGAIELFPFLELLPRAFSTHDPSTLRGTIFDGEWRQSLLTSFLPRVFGPPWGSILTNGYGFTGTRGFFGCAAFALALVALIGALRKPDRRTPVVTFLALVAAYAILKRYGNPLVNWTGYLPGFVQIDFPKYIEALRDVAVGTLSGFGIGYLVERTVGVRALVAAFGITLAFISALFLATRDLVPEGPLSRQYSFALLVGLAALLLVGLAAVATLRGGGRLRIAGAALAAFVLLAEPSVSYIWLTIWRTAPPIAENPYAGAPYLTYLANHVATDEERVFGIDGILFPNWAGAYRLADPRALNPLYTADYLPFVNAFLSVHPPAGDDLADRFTALRPIAWGSPLVQRWLALSSIGYLLAPGPTGGIVAPPGAFLNDLWSHAGSGLSPAEANALHLATVRIDGVSEDVLFEHPPNDVRYATVVPAGRAFAVADVALDPASYRGVICGGPVTFTLSATSAGRLAATTTRTIDPKHAAGDRHWFPVVLDLRSAAGRPVELRFRTSASDACAAWAVWGEPRFEPAGQRGALRATQAQFAEVFSAPGSYVYRVNGSLPRLALFHRAQGTDSFRHALDVLTSGGFDVLHEVVVTGSVPPLEPARGADRVVVTRTRSDLLEADVDAGSAGLLMQNDQWYPGWTATLDGSGVPILRVDGIFRGVAVPAGRHRLTFAYASPVAAAGTLLTLASCLALLVLLLWRPVRTLASARSGASSRSGA